MTPDKHLMYIREKVCRDATHGGNVAPERSEAAVALGISCLEAATRLKREYTKFTYHRADIEIQSWTDEAMIKYTLSVSMSGESCMSMRAVSTTSFTDCFMQLKDMVERHKRQCSDDVAHTEARR